MPRYSAILISKLDLIHGRAENMNVRGKSVVTIALTLTGMAVCLLPAMALAQNGSIQELLNRIDRVQRELSTLQRQVYQNRASSSSEGQPDALAPAETSITARQSIRISQLENEIRRLTGRMEEVNFLLRRTVSRLDKLVVDLDRRFALIEEKKSSVIGSEVPDSPFPQSVASIPSTAEATQAGILGTIPKDLAVTSSRDLATAQSQKATDASTFKLPSGTPRSQYEFALSLMLKQQNFSLAEEALKAFLDKHPRDNLASNAQYWLGETHYVRKNYQDAAFAFAEGYQKYPESRKAPDSLLKLGMSLSRMKKSDEACTAFSRFLSKYPKATDRLKARIDREWRQAKCR